MVAITGAAAGIARHTVIADGAAGTWSRRHFCRSRPSLQELPAS